jgi:hypothetical protein
MPYSVVVGYQRFRGPCCLHLNPETLVSYHITTRSQNIEKHDLNTKYHIRGKNHSVELEVAGRTGLKLILTNRLLELNWIGMMLKIYVKFST